MSVDMKTTVKSWYEVPNKDTQALGEFISKIQEKMLVHFGVVNNLHDIDDNNDNGFFPEIDLEVHLNGDPDGTTHRLVITNKPENYKGEI